ncbi:hypothetical protein CcaverHIS002_0303230 [Cutaneotrichosporon cavernicola]|nr:hypothetical protein CcaverHIS002_0303230 [Cutaneotrichosporon cavernicola]
MARNRLQQSGVPQQYGDQSAPGGNPYSSNPYSNNPESQPLAHSPYPHDGGASYPPNSQGGYAQGGGYNSSYGQQDQYASGGAGNGAGGGDFWSELNNTNALLGDLQQAIQAVRTAHSQTLNSTDQRAIQNADKVSADARALRQQCKDAVKHLFKLAKGDKTLRTQAETASKRFTGLLNEHQNIEKEYRQRSKEKAERQYRIVKPDATPEEVQQVINSDDPQVFATALLNSGRYSEARGAYKEVQDRHTEILKIEKTMTELAQMFQEMAMLVEQQDEAITQVENHAQQVNHDIRNEQLTGAITKAKAARRKKWICFWICIIICIVIACAVGIPLGIQAANKNSK